MSQLSDRAAVVLMLWLHSETLAWVRVLCLGDRANGEGVKPYGLPPGLPPDLARIGYPHLR